MAFEVMKNENTSVRYLYADHAFRAQFFQFSVKGVLADYAHLIACLASVFVRFRPEQTTRNESQRPRENPFLGPSFAPKQNGNACCASFSPDTKGQTVLVFNNKKFI